MSSNDTSTTENASPSTMHTGRVKWFNNKAGYGFVTELFSESDRVGEDYFVHHSALRVSTEQYKYLVQGEYVEFSLVESDSDEYEFQVGQVSGIYGGRLMCETREEMRKERRSNESGDMENTGSVEGGEEGWTMQQRSTRGRGGRGGRGGGRGSRRGGRGRGSGSSRGASDGDHA